MWAVPDGRRCESLFKLLFDYAQRSAGARRRRGMLNNPLEFDSKGLMGTAGVRRLHVPNPFIREVNTNQNFSLAAFSSPQKQWPLIRCIVRRRRPWNYEYFRTFRWVGIYRSIPPLGDSFPSFISCPPVVPLYYLSSSARLCALLDVGCISTSPVQLEPKQAPAKTIAALLNN